MFTNFLATSFTAKQSTQLRMAWAQMLFLVLSLWLSSAVAQAAYTVSTTTELITAVEKANQATGITSIYLKPGTYVMPMAYNSTDNAFPKITGKISLVGLFNGAIISRPGTAPAFRFFEIAPMGQLWMDRLTLSAGVGKVAGGAILNYGTLTINSSYFQRNRAVNANGVAMGGAIYNQYGKVTIRNSTFVVNHAEIGGAICSDGSLAKVPAPNEIARLTLETSALLENTAFNKGQGAMGGAMCVRGANETDIHDATFTGNFSQQYGGGIAFQFVPPITPVLLRNLTVFNNQATVEGSGLYYDCGTLPYSATAYIQIQNSIVTNNGPAAVNRDFGGNGVYKSLGYNAYGMGTNYFSNYPDYYLPVLTNMTYRDDQKPGDQYWIPEVGCFALNNGLPSNQGTTDQLGQVRGAVSSIGAKEKP